MKNAVIVILLIVVLAGLVLTNPSKANFAERYADRVNAELAEDLGLTGDGIGGTLGNLVGGLSQRAIQDYLEQQTKRAKLFCCECLHPAHIR